ncbi:MAG: cation diffusion facilitator family transporter [Alphaproteobacteria bacterium PRO2]|nr:cation diffusion facilitator family transporter [Alphaproteobacteria bacterium PRO2]
MSASNTNIRPRMALIAGAASVATVLVLIVIKLFALAQTGSASILASLIDSVVDASVSIMTFLAIRISLKPADEDHRHGHGKVEGLAALFQAAFIAGAGFFLLLESAGRFTGETISEDSDIAIAIMAVATILSVFLVMVQNYSLKFAPSLAVEADRAHYSSDILINVGVIGVLLGLQNGAPWWIDPVFAVFVAFYLAFTVRRIAGKAVDMLLDRELSGDARERITKKVLSHKYVMGMHDLRTSKSGMKIFISFDIELDPSLLLYNAHEIVREVEYELLTDFPNAEILIHADPHGDTSDTRHSLDVHG